MDRPRRESRQHNGITLRALSQLTFATKSARNGRSHKNAIGPTPTWGNHSQSITSLARPSSGSGKARPSVLSVFRRLYAARWVGRVRPVASVFMRFLFRSLYLWRRELVHRAFHPVAVAVGASRVDRVVVRRPWQELVDTHSENRVRVGHVQPDGGFGHLVKVLGIRAVVHDAEAFRRAGRCGA